MFAPWRVFGFRGSDTKLLYFFLVFDQISILNFETLSFEFIRGHHLYPSEYTFQIMPSAYSQHISAYFSIFLQFQHTCFFLIYFKFSKFLNCSYTFLYVSVYFDFQYKEYTNSLSNTVQYPFLTFFILLHYET